MNKEQFRIRAWVSAFVIFVIGDLVTTIHGMYTPGIVEGNPIYRDLYKHNNVIGIIVGKHGILLMFLALEYLLHQVIGALSIVIPLALTIFGSYILFFNIAILLYKGVSLFAIIVPILILGLIAIEVIDYGTKEEVVQP